MTDFATQLTSLQVQAEVFLAAHLPPPDTRPARLHEAMRYSVLAGGKRLRPVLCMAACASCGGQPASALQVGCAIELLHTYTLIHDDLPAMDDDDLRRGRPTCHRQFDEATAILAGDALQTMAFAWLTACTPQPPATAAQLVAELAAAAGSEGVIGGQMEDILAEGQPVDAERLAFIHRHKTGDLLRAAVRIGALCGGANPGALAKLSAYADAAGLAFPIADDILNATSDAAALGKGAGTDAARGKLTWVAAHGLDAARAKARALTEEALSTLADLPGDTSLLRGLARLFVERTS